MENNLKLSDKLLKVQKEIHTISKDSKNPHYKSNYADINSVLKAVKPVLNKYGILYLTPIEVTPCCSKMIVATQLTDGKDIYESKLVIQPNENPQKIGSQITYFRRYGLISLLGLEVDDDDGEIVATDLRSKATAQKVSALIRANQIEPARKYLATVDWSGKDVLKNKLISHFKNQ
jgi:hypothetical protein